MRSLGSTISMCLLLALAGCGGSAEGGGVCREGAPIECVCEDGRHGTGVCGVDRCDCPYALASDPASLDFGEVGAGEVRLASVAIANPAPREVALRSVEWLGASPGVYAFAGQVPATIPAGGSVSFAVRFAPVAPGSQVARIRVETADPDVAPVEVIVSGRTPGPVLACAPVALEFENAWVGATESAVVVCTNAGLAGAHDDARLPLTRLEVAGPGFSAAWREAPPEGGLAVGASAAIEVRFVPAEAGEHAGTLAVGGDAGTVAVALAGLAAELPACDVELPAELRAGVAVPGTEQTLEFAIRNRRTDAPCIVRAVRLCPGTDPAFSLDGGPYDGVTVPPGEELRIPVRFTPTADSCAEGEAPGCVEFELSPLPDGHRAVPLACELATGPDVLVTPGYLDFGQLRPGCETRDREVHVVNAGSTPVHLEELELSPDDGEFFLRYVPVSGTTIAPGASVPLTLAYRPEVEGEDLGALWIRIRERAEPLRVALAGRGDLAAGRDVFRQEPLPKLDVLVVIDNGLTMAAEATHLADLLGGLPESAIGSADARFAVTTTGLVAAGPGCPGGADGGEDGRFFPVDGSRPRVVDETTPNLRATWEANLAVGTCQTAPAQTLEAAIRALSPPLSTSADDPRHPEPNDGNQGFLRPDARLLVIAVSDRADASPGQDDAYYQALLAVKGGDARRVVFDAITGNRTTGCTAADGRAAVAGDRLIGMVERTPGGFVESICAGGGGLHTEPPASGLRTCFHLEDGAVDRNGNGIVADVEGELRVLVDGVEVPSTVDGQRVWSYSTWDFAVCFTPEHVPAPGSTIEVDYAAECLPS